MGFWSNVGNGLKKMGEVAGRAIETVGSVIKNERIEKFGRVLKDFCTPFEGLGSYEKKSSTTSQTAEVNQLLVTLGTEFETRLTELEDEILDGLKNYFVTLISEVEGRTDVSTKRLVRSILKSEKHLKGKLKGYTAHRISIDDPECLAILQSPPGDEKSEKMRAFGDKVMKESLNKLADDVNSFIDEQSKLFSDTLKQTMERHTRQSEEKERQILGILASMQDESQGKDREMVKPLTLLSELRELRKVVS
ncbi:hypothetical protein SZL87_15670 [Exiguobacterium indicum]|uniref:BAR domain-containing protein n=1 Tax=Exiguobacterium indicum TaxID=296995 RepID=A0ABU8ELP1_9BACL